MNYAISLDCISNENPGWIFTPWKLKGAIIYDKISKVPDNSILVVSHFAPWWEPLKTKEILNPENNVKIIQILSRHAKHINAEIKFL